MPVEKTGIHRQLCQLTSGQIKTVPIDSSLLLLFEFITKHV